MMLDNIPNIIQFRCKLHTDSLLLVGVSGGPDSLTLLHILCQLGYSIIAMHINHKLRPEADEEMQLVKQVAEDFNVEFITRQVDVQDYSNEHSISIEEAARILRYRSLFEQAESHGASAVVVGHNADDQVETILLHLLRGTGLSGLRGMEFRSLPNPWSEVIPLVRPLLSTWRTDIQIYIDEYELKPLSDRSNLDPSFFRNRLRHELLPFMEEYNPNFREVLLRMSESLKDDFAVIQELVDNAWEKILLEQDPGILGFHSSTFVTLPLSLQRDLLRKAIQYHLPGLRDVGFECIERGLLLLSGDKLSAQADLIAGIRLIKDGDRFWVVARDAVLPQGDYPAIPPGISHQLTIPGVLLLNNGWEIIAEEITDPDILRQQYHANQDPFQAWLDVSGLEQPLVARSRNFGDQIRPLGLNGHTMKISDLMINLKLPNRARSTWPLICSGEDVLWVPGYRLSHLARIKPGIHQAIQLVLRKRQAS